MNDYIPFRGGKCYTEAERGFSGAFSWWTNKDKPGSWFVCGYGPFCQSGFAVVDDFGNLVQVS